jgi:uncharacterized OB-fold protein
MPIPDPRPRTQAGNGVIRVDGWRCGACGYAVAVTAPRCPRCRGPLEPEAYGPDGHVWASTVVHVELPGRTPPYALTYVDLEHGPRVLGHVAGEARRVRAGTPVRLVGLSTDGDLVFDEER